MERDQRFIIEHPRRGTFKELDHGIVPSDDVKARFSLTGARNDPAKTKIYSMLSNAWKDLQSIPAPLRFECNILVYNPADQTYYKLVKT